MDRCPVCRARYKGEECYRCGADLMPLIRLENRARHLEMEAARYLAAHDLLAARACLIRSLAFQRRPLSAALLWCVQEKMAI